MKALEQFLRPEFINRVDEVICFNRLTEENFKGIAAIMLKELQDSLRDKGITFTYGDSLVEFLVEKSYSMTYGARNLRRTIQKPEPLSCRRNRQSRSFASPRAVSHELRAALSPARNLYTLRRYYITAYPRRTARFSVRRRLCA